MKPSVITTKDDNAQETTLDGLLGRRVTLEQPATGYRVAADTVLLAAAVPAQASEKILDLGCGAGGAMLCLAGRVPGIAVTGAEIRDELRLLCRNNIARNRLKADLSVQYADATKLSPAFAGIFHHVMINPPYHDEARHDVSGNAQKRAANAEKDGDLPLWLANAAKALKSSGILTMIHRADRREEIVRLMPPVLGALEILPLVPKTGAAPKRIILRARKGAPRSIVLLRDFVLHRPDGSYADEAEAVLRDGKALLPPVGGEGLG